jgi:hypothetical protein
MMRRFHASVYSGTSPTAAALTSATELATGGAPGAAGGSPPDVADYLQYVSVARELVLPSDPEERAQILKAKIKNFQGMKRRFPIAAVFYDNEIRKMRAKLSASGAQITKKKKGEESTQTFRYLGWAAGGLFVVLLGSMIYKNVVTARSK